MYRLSTERDAATKVNKGCFGQVYRRIYRWHERIY